MHPSTHAIAHSPSLPIAELPLLSRELSRPGVMGLNSNISVEGVIFHVQTEDLGPKHPQIVTNVFSEGGHVVKVVRIDYARHADKPNLHLVLPKLLMAHHTNIVTKVKRGAFSEDSSGRIQPPIGNAEGLQSDRCKSQSGDPLSIPDVPNDIDAPVSTTTSNVETGDVCEASDCHGVRPSSSFTPASRTAREIWDYLVAKAQCEHTSADSTNRSGGSAPSVDGARIRLVAVDARVQAKIERSPSAHCGWDLALLARHHDDVLDRVRRSDKTDALIHSGNGTVTEASREPAWAAKTGAAIRLIAPA